MIPVSEALAQIFKLVAPLETEFVPLRHACNRVLSKSVKAARTQPPFAASAMDGYAVRQENVGVGAKFAVIGEAAAGHRFDGTVQTGQAVRIFTGAPMPEGADRVIIQEDVVRDDNTIVVQDGFDTNLYVRAAGKDFAAGDEMAAPRMLTSSDVALLAAMNVAEVPVTRKPVVAIIPTGDELVQPGEAPGPDQIIASNSYGLTAMLEGIGAEVRLLPIARDSLPALELTFELAAGADLIVTIGGASDGDHDLVAQAAASRGLDRSFYKVAMRPGKPLMAGRLGDAVIVGLPGNPVSAIVCGHVFLVPAIRKLLGMGETPSPRHSAVLAKPIAQNGPREHYMRARLDHDGVTVFERQDSALLTVLADANCLAVRPVDDPAKEAGEAIEIIRL